MYTVQLRVTNSGNESTAVHPVSVLPPTLPGNDYPLIAFFREVESGPNSGGEDLYVMNPSSGMVTRIGGGPGADLGVQTVGWERSGARLATETGGHHWGVAVYDLQKDEVVKVSTPGAQSAWTVAWNPQKDWIAYAERGRESFMEPVLVRPDGSERLFVGGANPRPEVSGLYPSWSPDGERLALANTNYSGLTEALELYGIYDRRISVFSDFWGGNVTRVQVPSEEQLMGFLDSIGENNLNNRVTIQPGCNGFSWSPDGEWLAYTIRFGFIDAGGSKEYLLKSRVDGTGDIEIRLPGENAPGATLGYFLTPRWSPNGHEILFYLWGGDIMKMGAEGGPPAKLVSGGTFGWYQ
jgi:Tol biopolymer transport system component